MSHPISSPSVASIVEMNPEIDYETTNKEVGIPEVIKAETEHTKLKGSEVIYAKSSNVSPAGAEARTPEAVGEVAKDIRCKEGRQPGVKLRGAEGDEIGVDEEKVGDLERGSMTAGAEDNDNIIVIEDNQNEEKEETADLSEIPEDLYEALRSIEDNGTFATSGDFSSAPNPVLSIDGIGMVGLPLSDRDAEAIIAAASQAPFGHGERTVVGTDVRDTWELQPNQIQFLNPIWRNWIEKEVLAKVANDLGIANAEQTVSCELYKVLLYKKGGHFLPHRDTEKSPGMFGTLMVVLPSFFTGGAVKLSHSGMQKEFDFGGPTSITNTSYAAWYTDILHSVLPVTSGHRLALSYNMIHKGPTATPRLSDSEVRMKILWSVLKTWSRNADEPECPTLLGWMLEHQYSEQALNGQKIGALKGADKCRGLALLALAKELGFELYLSQIEYQKTGTVADDDYYGYGRRRRYGYGYGYRYCDDDSDDDPEGKTMDDVIEESLTAKTLINCKTGHPLPPDFIPIFNKDDCIPAEYWDEEEPNTKSYEGYTGNAEATLDYWYKRTAIIIWPTKVHAESVGYLAYRWDRVVFLDRLLWTQAEIDQGKRLKFGEDIIEQLATMLKTLPIPYYEARGLTEKDQLYANELMGFALEEKRLDLFLKIVDLAQSTDIVKMTQAAKVFGVDGVRHVVQRCISNTKGIENKLRAAIQFYYGQPDELKTIAKQLVDAISISKEVKPESFKRLHDLMGPELFQICIIPNLGKDFSNTAFWISLWQQYPMTDWINNILPGVVHAHKTQICLTKDAGRFSINPDTLTLFYKVLEVGRADLASEIIQKIQAIPKPPDAEHETLKEHYATALTVTIKRVMQTLERHNIPITAEPYANFIKKTFVDRVLPTLGPRPRPGQDFRLQTMRATEQSPCCPNCDAVDIFLSDPRQQVVSYTLNYLIREHLEQRLRERKNISVRNNPLPSRWYGRRNTVVGMITITKVGLSLAEITDKWDRARAEIERSFIEIGDEQTRKEIFGGLFPIIQMGVRNYGMGWGKEMKEAVLLGEQEEQQMYEQQLQDHARMTANAMDHLSRSGTASTSANRRSPPASLSRNADDDGGGGGDVQITSMGRKRKRSTRVIDLTDE